MVHTFIKRPVLSTVISIVIMLIGVIGLITLPITQYPDIAPPMVKVEASYPGASADVVLKSVVTPIEEEINGVEGMTYITSTAGNDGGADINVYFELGVDPDMAAVNVQNRVSKAMSRLPKEVVQTGVSTKKMQNTMVATISIFSDNPEHDETFIQNYARINIYPALQRVNGVGRIGVFGVRDYAMRIWLDPVKMASYGLVPSDVMGAINEQSLEAAPGKFGANSDQVYEYVIKYKGRMTDVSEYENIVIRSEANGKMLRLKDVARIEFGAFDYSLTSTAKGSPGVVMAVYQSADSNARDIVNDVTASLTESAKDFPKGMQYSIPYNSNEFLDSSIKSVLRTLLEAFILVFLIVYIFLQDFRSTLIPAIAAIVAIVGTFFFLKVFGFSINILTLFALVLAIGTVVDDAIVVVEAVHSKMQQEHLNARKATNKAMSEITGAIISITFVITAVFLPVAFMPGPAGEFYKQFAITLSVAVLISAVNALTLSPALCAILIKPHKNAPEDEKKLSTRFHKQFNTAFDVMNRKYANVLDIFIKRKWLTGMILLVATLLTVVFIYTTPTSFIPTEDKGSIFVDISMPAATTLERTKQVIAQIDSIVSSMEVVQDRITVSGSSLLSGSFGGSYGMLIIKLKPWEERDNDSMQKTIKELYAKTAHIKEAKILFFTPPTVSGFGIADGFELQLQDRTGGSVNDMSKVAQDFIAALSNRKEIKYATTSFNVNFPQYQLDVDADKCKQAGVKVNDLFSVMQGYYGGFYASDFNKFTKLYRVMIQADPNARKDVESINRIMVRNNKGEMVPINTMVNFKRIYGSENIKRFNLFNAVTINGQAAEGYSSGDAIKAINEVAQTLPAGFSFEYSGMTREEIKTGSQAILIFVLSFIFVYLILCAQYESYILPLAVMVSLIVGIFGVFLSVQLAGLDNNIYVQVALIMLIGLLAKNGILIVEFARQRRQEGLSIVEAAKEAAVLRLRPILMTSFTFVFGLFPLVIATGAGALGNRSIGTGASGGFFVATVLGVFIIPVLFIFFQTLDEKLRGKSAIKIQGDDDDEE